MLLSELAELFRTGHPPGPARSRRCPGAEGAGHDPTCECRMNTSITARELFEQQRERLGLRWAAGKSGGTASWRPATRSRGVPRWPATSTPSIPTRCRSSAPRNCPGWTRWNRASVGRPSKDHAVASAGAGADPQPGVPEDLRAAADESGRRCGCRPSAATNCSTTCPTTWRARWRRGSSCTACSWRSIPSAC
jgi:hypothetical protein